MPWIAPALVAMLLLAGCGGDDTGQEPARIAGLETEPAALGREQFIAAADDLCRRFAEETAEQTREYEALAEQEDPSARDLRRAAELLREIAADGRRMLQRVRELPAPDGDEDAVARQWTRTEAGISILRRLADAIGEQDEGRIEALSAELEATTEQASALARRYGHEACGAEEGP